MKDSHLGIRIDSEIKSALLEQAEKEGRSLSNYITYILKGSVLKNGISDNKKNE